MTMTDTDRQTATPAMTLYGKMLTFSRLQLHTNDLSLIDAQLATTLSNKTSNIPVIIDSSVEQDLPALVEFLWSWGLQPIGAVTGILEEQARTQRLAIFPADGKRIERILPVKKPITQPAADSSAQANDTPNNSASNTADALTTDSQASSASAATDSESWLPAEHITSMIYDQMLRSGQSLNHVGGDLILTNSINSGAEAITDNSLHVYGRAQGRLVAGATGDKDARIFCQVFNPSLVSVAGTYCLRDNIPQDIIDKSVQVRFVEGEGLVFTVMDGA
ncbi:septum site-determining protein MinC [Psychrobacter submarinus]|jgi:septum site-determining protein MinC|uniref:septum site-determining protein MinC n=1 Tax=Psychrobacter submarinus TaxID=154108 RepID=UPI000C4A2E14|nr:septum site-determining protein MinC [Psychrobacter submarinus]MAE40663.1 septum site-determining protein MinC [Psychrobacter sp.]